MAWNFDYDTRSDVSKINDYWRRNQYTEEEMRTRIWNAKNVIRDPRATIDQRKAANEEIAFCNKILMRLISRKGQ